MSMRILLALVPVLLLAVACGDSDGDRDLVKNADGLYLIERLDLTNVPLEISDIIEPSIKNPYPDVVARVNGEEITGEDLFSKQVAQELVLREAIPNYLHVVLLMDTGGDIETPLESLIDERLLNQAILRLDLAPLDADYYLSILEEDLVRYREFATLEEIGEERRREYATAVEEIEDALRLQDLPLEGWAASGPLHEKYRMGRGLVALVRSECSFIFANYERPLRSSCGEFLVTERENADIEYFVVWAE